MILQVYKLKKSFTDVEVLKDISFLLNKKDVAFVIGKNGSGKTTLFNILTDDIDKDSGDIIKAKGLRIATLKQFNITNPNNTIYDEVLEEKREIINLFLKLKEIEQRISDGENELIEEHDRIHSKILDLNGYAYESQVEGIIFGLGFAGNPKKRLVSELSGGEKTRLFLAKMFASDCELVLLDEPTNHLDMKSMEWLEDYIKNSKKTYLIISHDRHFIDKCANKIIEIKNSKSSVYKGNYSDYIKKSEELYNAKLKEYVNQQKYIDKQKKIIERFKQFNREKSLRQARSREKLLNRLDLIENPYTNEDTISNLITSRRQSGKDVLICENLSKSFDDKELFKNINFDIKKGEIVSIIGENGCGKSTLLKMIVGDEGGYLGNIHIGSNVDIGYLDQNQDNFHYENTIIDELHSRFPNMTNFQIRTALAGFNFIGDDVMKTIDKLSGGERVRLKLCILFIQRPNFLILDEPTNHLDISMKDIIENMVLSYDATVLLVSHDRYFINNVSDRILSFENKRLINYQGNYDYYLEKCSNEIKDEIKFIKNKENNWIESKKHQSEIRKIKNRITSINKEIIELDSKIEYSNIMMSDEKISTDFVELEKYSRIIEDCEIKMIKLMDEEEDLKLKLEELE